MVQQNSGSDDLKFLEGKEQELKALNDRFKETVTGQLEAGGDLRALIDGLSREHNQISQEVARLRSETKPLAANVKKGLAARCKDLQDRVDMLGDRMKQALDAEWPPASQFAWATFCVGIALLLVGFAAYVGLHRDRPLAAALRGIDIEKRVDLAMSMGAIKSRALALDRLPAPAEGEEAEQDDLQHTLRVEMQSGLEEAKTALTEAGFSDEIQGVFLERYGKIKEQLAEKTPSGKMIAEQVDQVYEQVLKEEAPFFWDQGIGRYVEVGFGSFFGIMAFALYNYWKNMRKPGRLYWTGWYVAKILGALIISWALIAILSQVNFATPQSLKDQTAVGLGTASMDVVMAFSILSGYFSHLAVEFLEDYAERVFKGLKTGQVG